MARTIEVPCCRRGRRSAARIVAVTLLLASATSSVAAGAAPTRGSAPTPEDRDWTVYGHDLSNTRLNSKETKVNRKSVARLTAKWSKDGIIGVSGTPVVYLS
jgi:glucose dehydrogenase